MCTCGGLVCTVLYYGPVLCNQYYTSLWMWYNRDLLRLEPHFPRSHKFTVCLSVSGILLNFVQEYSDIYIS